MSNTVDVLLIDGPADGLMVCSKRPVEESIMWHDYKTMTQVEYLHREYRSEYDEKMYHVALFNETADDTDDLDIELAIAHSGFTPAWDLNPMGER